MKRSFPAINRNKRFILLSPDEKPKKTTFNYSILISTFAVVISLFTFYFTNFRIDDHLLVKIIDIEERKNSDALAKKDTLTVHFLYTNLGNRQALILAPNLAFRPTAKSDTLSGGIGFWDRKIYPLVIEPHQTKIVKIDLPYKKFISSIPDYYTGTSGKKTTIINGKRNYEMFLGITYFGINSNSQHVVKSNDFSILVGFTDSEFTFTMIDPSPERGNWYQNEPTEIF